MNRLLNLREYLDHLLVQVRVVGDHDLGVPCHSDKDGINTTAEWRGEDVADLQANEKGKGADDHGEASGRVVRGFREFEVKE